MLKFTKINSKLVLILSISICIFAYYSNALGSVSDNTNLFQRENPQAWQATMDYKKAIQTNNSQVIQLLIHSTDDFKQIAFLQASLLVAEHKLYNSLNRDLLISKRAKSKLPLNYNFHKLIASKDFKQKLKVSHGADCAILFDRKTGAYIALTRIDQKWFVDMQIDTRAYDNPELYAASLCKAVLIYRKAAKSLAKSNQNQQAVLDKLNNNLAKIWKDFDNELKSAD